MSLDRPGVIGHTASTHVCNGIDQCAQYSHRFAGNYAYVTIDIVRACIDKFEFEFEYLLRARDSVK